MYQTRETMKCWWWGESERESCKTNNTCTVSKTETFSMVKRYT